MMRARVATGIAGLDEVMEGGLQQGKTSLISGETGTGKTIFCLQYILEGLSRGENGVYLTIDEKPAHLVEDATSLGWDLETPISKNRLVLMDMTPEFSELRLGRFEGDIEHETFIGEVKKYVKKVKAKRVVIDPIVPMFSSPDNQFQLREYIRRMMFSLDEIGTTNLVSSFIPTGSNSISRFGVEEFFASGVMVLGIEREEMMYHRVLLIRKMRGTAIDLRVRRYVINSDTGISLTYG